jgi:hypothetical protein
MECTYFSFQGSLQELATAISTCTNTLTMRHAVLRHSSLYAIALTVVALSVLTGAADEVERGRATTFNTATIITTTTTTTRRQDDDDTFVVRFHRDTPFGVVQVIDYDLGGNDDGEGEDDDSNTHHNADNNFGNYNSVDTSAATATDGANDEGHPSTAIRFLRCGDSIVGAAWLDEDEYGGQSAFLNFAIHQAVIFRLPKPRRALQLGLGAGTVPTALRAAGALGLRIGHIYELGLVCLL